MPPSERELLIALHHTPGVGPTKWQQLADAGEPPLALLGWPQARLSAWLGDNAAGLIRDWQTQRPGNWLQQRLDSLNRWLDQPGQHLFTRLDPGYPELLRQADGPLLLHLRGDPDLLCSDQLAMVGSRKPTAAGRKAALDFAGQLASAGLTITSGLALGIDACAHQGALTGGRTLAVLGSGLDQVYPLANRVLAEQIVAQGGALVSEFGLGVKPQAGHFPRRNRIISGLSLGTLVVEAALQSGSLITARLALAHNREVFALPGSIYNPLAEGCHWLIREGAVLVSEPAQLLEQLGWRQSLPALRSRGAEQAADPELQALLQQIGLERVDFETLLAQSGLEFSRLHQLLTELELAGWILSSEAGYERAL